MQNRNAELIKERIMGFVQSNGPSIPIQVSRRIQMDGIFTAAFLSELVSEKKLKMTNMRMGSSPVYFLEGQETQLEKFGEQYLKSKEKDAFFLIREKKFLKDSEQEPAIRVALRAIKDFAIQFTKNSETFWKYYLIDEKEFYLPIEELKKPKHEEKIIEIVEEKKGAGVGESLHEPPVNPMSSVGSSRAGSSEIVSRDRPEKPKKSPPKKSKKPASKKQDDKFLEKVKEFLSKDSIEITNIEGLGKNELTLRIKVAGEEQLLVAFNKKKIDEKDILKAAKKSLETGLKYSVLSLGELPKKMSDLIEALKNIKEIEKIE